MLAAFFHDAGKSGDCIYNMYDEKKYGGAGDQTHPIRCGDLFLNKAEYKVCDDKGENPEKINFSEVIETKFNKYLKAQDR